MIIGVSGPAGAGKDTAAQYIADSLHIQHVSGGDILRGMLRELGKEPTKKAVSDFGTLMRQQHGADFVIQKVLARAKNIGVIVNSGFRSPEEGRVIQDNGGKIIYIDAPAQIRFERISNRNRGDDQLGIRELRIQDKKEASSQDPLSENLQVVREMADFVIINDGAIEMFHERLNEVIDTLRESDKTTM